MPLIQSNLNSIWTRKRFHICLTLLNYSEFSASSSSSNKFQISSSYPKRLEKPTRTKYAGLTVFVHAHLQAFFQSTCLALIAMCLIYDASAGTRLTPENQIGQKEKLISDGWSIDHGHDFQFRRWESKRLNQLWFPFLLNICALTTDHFGIKSKSQHNKINHIFDWLHCQRTRKIFSSSNECFRRRRSGTHLVAIKLSFWLSSSPVRVRRRP